MPDSMEEKARRIHEKVLAMDSHVDINLTHFTDSTNYTQNLDSQVNLPKMIQGGLDAVWLIVYTTQGTLDEDGYTRASKNALAKFEAIHRLCNSYAPKAVELAQTSSDVRRIKAAGKKVVVIGVENAYPLGEDLSQLEDYYERGARYITLSHNGHNQFCDSHTGENDNQWLHGGLSNLGVKAISEMNRLGMLIDVSHTSRDSMIEAVAHSKSPVIASHSSARALCDHSRNLDDEQLLMIKENGGVVQAVAFNSYLNTEKHKIRAAYIKPIQKQMASSLGVHWYDRSKFSELTDMQQEEFMRTYPKISKMAEAVAASDENAPPAVNVSDFVDHIDHMVERIGIEHVGISSDFDGGGGIEGWSDASETFNVTLELVRRGYSEDAIAKLWGENLLRVLDEAQAVAASLK